MPTDATQKGGTQPGRVWLVGAGPGEPDLITWRGLELLRRADVVLHDALSHPALLRQCPQAKIINVGKRYGHRATPQQEITSQLIALARAGHRVVRLKGGDPLVFARGAEEALALAEAGIAFDVVPAVTSSVAASAFAGISLTHRDLSSSVTFITGSDQTGKQWSPDAWKKLATATGTICIYMGMRRIEEIAQAIIAGGRDPSTPAAVVQWGARPQQRTVVARLDELAKKVQDAGLANPAIIIVGDVVSLREQMNWFETKPLFGKTLLVARAAHQAEATTRAIRERAAAALEVPAIEILPPDDLRAFDEALLQASDYDWVLFTSTNGVEAAFSALDRLERDGRVFGTARVAAIGPRTAEALRVRGIRSDLVATRFVAESLLEDLLAAPGKLERVLVIRAAVAREVLPEALRQQGVDVDVVAAYQTRPVSGEARERLRHALVEDAEIVLLTSSSMVDSIVSALGDEAGQLLAERTIACIGPVTAATAREHGLRVDVEAETYTVEGTLDALEAFAATQS